MFTFEDKVGDEILSHLLMHNEFFKKKCEFHLKIYNQIP